MKTSHRVAVATAVLAMPLILASCAEAPDETSGSGAEVKVPARKVSRDPSWVLDKQAVITVEEAWGGGMESWVKVRAKLSHPNDPDNDNDLWLDAKVMFKSGAEPVECGMPRSQIWSSGEKFEKFSMGCGVELDLKDITEVRVR